MIEELYSKIPEDIKDELGFMSKLKAVLAVFVVLPFFVLIFGAFLFLGFQQHMAYRDRADIRAMSSPKPKEVIVINESDSKFIEYKDRFGQFDDKLD